MNTLDSSRNFEDRLSQEVDHQGKNDPFTYMAAAKLSKDVFMKEFYQRKVMECIQSRKTLLSYISGIIYFRDIEREDRQEILTSEMVHNFPLRGRLLSYLRYIFFPLTSRTDSRI